MLRGNPFPLGMTVVNAASPSETTVTIVLPGQTATQSNYTRIASATPLGASAVSVVAPGITEYVVSEIVATDAQVITVGTEAFTNVFVGTPTTATCERDFFSQLYGNVIATPFFFSVPLL